MSNSVNDVVSAPPPARVSQIAEVLSASVQEVVKLSRDMGITAENARSIIGGSETEMLLRSANPPGDLEECRAMISQAFEASRAAGKPDWEEMSLAVLKNRLLDLTERGFRESEYGAPNMAYLAFLTQDLLEAKISESGVQSVHFKGHTTSPGERPEPEALSAGHSRLRRDLWVAFVDYRVASYVWDVVAGKAIAGEAGPGRLQIPSLTPQIEAGLRGSFRESVAPELEVLEEHAVDEWVNKRLGTPGLPPSLRGRWNGFFRDSVVQRIVEFFKEVGIAPPSDMLSDNKDHHGDSSPSALRAFVMRCIDIMTEEELASLPLGAAISLRAQRPGH